MRINWRKVWNEAYIPRDRRLLLIAKPTNVTPDGGLLDSYDVVVGYWNRHRGAFVPAHIPLQSYDQPILKVTYWAELPVPEGIKLRSILEKTG
jgi:hypothetical protein